MQEEMEQSYFVDFKEFNAHLKEKASGTFVIAHRNVADYAGMVLCLFIRFDCSKSIYDLNLEWMCLGLDFYGDTLVESYEYRFEDLRKLLAYIEQHYGIHVTHLERKHEFKHEDFPNRLRNEELRPLYHENWERFQRDYELGKFLDRSMHVVYPKNIKF